VLSTALFMLMQFYDPAVIREHIETKLYDLRLYIRGLVVSPEPPGDIMIVTVDEKSIAQVGRWPWSRAVTAKLVDAVAAGEPRVIGVDILFSEAEGAKPDRALADAFARAGNVVLATGFLVGGGEEDFERPEADYLWDHAFMKVVSTEAFDWKQWVVKPANVLIPIERIAREATLGSVYMQPDLDGVLRWEILYMLYEDDFYGSLSLQVAREALGVPLDEMELLAGRGVRLGDRIVPTDLSGRMLVNYRGGEGSIRYIPAVDVMEGAVPPETFTDKIVFIGTSAVATYDQKVTPLSSNLPGVEKNATVTKNIIDQSYIRKSPGVIEMVITVVTAFILSFLLQRLNAIRGTLLALSLITLYFLFGVYFFTKKLVWINLLYPTMNMFAIFIVQTTTKFFLEERKARDIRKMFSSYVSPTVVEALIGNPELAKLGGHRRTVTIMFSDIAGFTSLSENRDPEEVVALLNEYFTAMTDAIFRWQGTFDKIVGDEIMAFWGAPLEQPNHAELTVRCTLDMLNTLLRLQLKWQAEGKPVISCGFGINTGEVLVGNIGALDKKMDYTVIGDTVNAAARVEALTRQYNAKILVTEFTAVHVRKLIDEKRLGHVDLVYRDSVKVKGKEIPLGIYELIDTEVMPQLLK
jgi:adenylate cyclase